MEKRRSNVVNMSPRDKKSEEHYALGTVYAASGFRVKKFTTFKRKLPTITDWTLIRPFRGRALKSNNVRIEYNPLRPTASYKESSSRDR
ncbi:uncharacterized protein BDW43DRAFT_277296 [Aspergillus alliaceus]|uniref:uncharacterized protein n=1 Tax=Petromyces alliaceus TaxID=209559 RepID=UPI0012A4190F|nr:uncharacterized protein BDW43DRAFT_277296 [Aspergillus alliaceus]KAB8233088.1 hypothetical protein BDW43DRAFT_277296 [Aspergillus alliaceus]